MSRRFLPENERNFDPQAEHAFWSSQLFELPYVDTEVADYDEYAPAFEYGWENYLRHAKLPRGAAMFAEIEAELALQWRSQQGADGLPWQMARHAVRDAWDRLEARLGAGVRKRGAE